MTREQTSYAAIITIRLPGAEQQATASVTLLPPDAVPANGRFKLLRDCTLAELQAYADEWETAVWETYHTIKLGDLAADEQVDVDIAVASDGNDLPDWLAEAIVLPAEAEDTAAEPERLSTKPDDEETADIAPAADVAPTTDNVPIKEERIETAVADTEPPMAADDTDAQPSSAPTEEQDMTETADEDDGERDEEPEITVSESEPVYEEKEAGDEYEALAVPVRGPKPGRIAGDALPAHHPTWRAVDVFIEEPALRTAQSHALSSPLREVAGVLVGPRPEKQPDGRYRVHISDTVVAKHTVMQGASVTYTPESWRYINDQLSEKYPDETAIIVGWYHTHPGFGIFLSGMDQFIHHNFFTQIWHVALVLDPRSRTAGFFCWNREKTKVERVDFHWPAWTLNW